MRRFLADLSKKELAILSSLLFVLFSLPLVVFLVQKPVQDRGQAADGPIIADHQAVAQFDQISSDWVTAASNQRLLQLRASTGMYISSGLCCLQGRRLNADYDPPCLDEVQAMCSDEYGLDVWNRHNWHFISYSDICDSPAGSDGEKVDCLAQQVAAHRNDYDAFSLKFCYTPFWQEVWGVEALWNHYRETMESLEAARPDKTFVWWTKPLIVPEMEAWTEEDCQETEEFNRLVRDYAWTHEKVLYDIADIEAHDENGARCPGKPTAAGECEAMCSQCSGGGHPSDHDCKLRLAKAYWWLMARVAGWEDGGGLPPTSTPFPTPTPTFTPIPTPTFTPDLTPTPGVGGSEPTPTATSSVVPGETPGIVPGIGFPLSSASAQSPGSGPIVFPPHPFTDKTTPSPSPDSDFCQCTWKFRCPGDRKRSGRCSGILGALKTCCAPAAPLRSCRSPNQCAWRFRCPQDKRQPSQCSGFLRFFKTCCSP